MAARLTFVSSDVVARRAKAVFDAHERRIRSCLPDAEIRHHGGSSLPGILTSGDVDVHVRTDRLAFAKTRDVLSTLYDPLFPDEWSSEVAYFVACGSEPPVEIVLTVMGSNDDLHHRDTWERIAADPDLRERYNALKRAHEGASMDDYKAAKRAFFYGVVRALPREPRTS